MAFVSLDDCVFNVINESSSVCTSELLSQEREADNAEPQSQSSGPSESEVALQESLNRLGEEKEALTSQYQAQVQYVLHWFLRS